MKRLTTYRADGRAAIANNENATPKQKVLKIPKVIDRLASIEDILGDEYDLDRLAELAQTDREGRVVVLPFKPPKWVWMCSRKFPKPAQAHYDSAINILCDMDRGCVFGDTPEEAEEALKAREQE